LAFTNAHHSSLRGQAAQRRGLSFGFFLSFAFFLDPVILTAARNPAGRIMAGMALDSSLHPARRERRF